jgi:hypothetical protein
MHDFILCGKKFFRLLFCFILISYNNNCSDYAKNFLGFQSFRTTFAAIFK